ncbi:MAG: hypothetical protein R2837_06695 [Aliarcobacter sp.]
MADIMKMMLKYIFDIFANVITDLMVNILTNFNMEKFFTRYFDKK